MSSRQKGVAVEQKVESVERALTLLEAFSDGSRTLTLGDLAERTGLYRSTILRLAASLDRFGYLRRGEDGLFRLGPTLWRLGVVYQNGFELADYVRPILSQLVENSGETAAFYIREGERRIVLFRHHAPRLIRHHLDEGAELPLDRGASAHILRAYTGGQSPLDARTREAGFYVSLGERDPETVAIAVPIFGAGRKLVGSLGITGMRSRFGTERISELRDLLLSTANRLTRTLGG